MRKDSCLYVIATAAAVVVVAADADADADADATAALRVAPHCWVGWRVRGGCTVAVHRCLFYVRGLFISSYRCFTCSGIQSKVVIHSGLGSGFLLDTLVKSEVFLFVFYLTDFRVISVVPVLTRVSP